METLPQELPRQCWAHTGERICVAWPAVVGPGATGAQVAWDAVEGPPGWGTHGHPLRCTPRRQL